MRGYCKECLIWGGYCKECLIWGGYCTECLIWGGIVRNVWYEGGVVRNVRYEGGVVRNVWYEEVTRCDRVILFVSLLLSYNTVYILYNPILYNIHIDIIIYHKYFMQYYVFLQLIVCVHIMFPVHSMRRYIQDCFIYISSVLYSFRISSFF